MPPELVELAKGLGPVILTGSILLGIAAVIRSRAEAVKLRKEAKKTEVETEGLPGAESVSAQAMREAIATMREIASDANASRERAEQSEERMRVALESSRSERAELWDRIHRLERAQAEKDREAEAQRHQITRLEAKLLAARDMVNTLVAFLKKHTPAGVHQPTIDYSIFDR